METSSPLVDARLPVIPTVNPLNQLVNVSYGGGCLFEQHARQDEVQMQTPSTEEATILYNLKQNDPGGGPDCAFTIGSLLPSSEPSRPRTASPVSVK